jgi:protein HIRA/HIR1
VNLFLHFVSQYSCCAVGSRDRSLSVWLTCLRRPLVVIHDLFDESVVDISWSSTGYELMLCSLDGTVIYIELNEKELGRPVSDQQKDQWFIEHYGQSVGQSRESKQLIEDPSLLSLQQKSGIVKQKDVMAAHMAMPASSGKTPGQSMPAPLPPSVKGLVSTSSTSTTSPVKGKQKETVMKDGRRRITPFSITLQSGGFTPTTFGSSVPFPSTQTTTQSSGSQSSETGAGAQAQPSSEKAILKSTTPTALQVRSTVASTDRTRSTETSSALKAGSKRKKDDTGLVSKKPRKDQTASAISATASKSGKDDGLSIAIMSTMTIALPQPDVLAQRTLQVVHAVGGQEINVTLEIANSNVPGRAHRIVCRHGNAVQWETCLSSKGVALAGSRHVVAVACENRTVHVFSSCGRRLLPGLVLLSAISVLQCNAYYLMAVTTGGDVFVWDMKRLCAVIRKESLLPVLKGGKVSITKVQLTADGLPIISLSSQCSYTFSLELGVWVLLDDRNDVIRLSANVQAYASPEVEGLLASLQGNCIGRGSVGHLPRVYTRDTSQLQMATVAFLENQVTAALACQSSDEYHHWLLSYVKYLASQGLESKLQELCVELIGPPGQSVRKLTSTQGWNQFVLGLSKRSLLKEMLPILATNGNLQRLASEIHEQLR